MGFVAAATHAAADALRGQPTPPGTTVAARRALVRLRRRWRGAEPWWADDAPGVPTPHQVEVAVRVADLGSAEAVAQERTLSRRTVENHVYRVARALALSDRDELLHVLQPLRAGDDLELP